ncbi:MAG: PbpA [Deltaproteobacteria bacterium]|nr:PbpA [Deltaproteobacteria bacterium]
MLQSNRHSFGMYQEWYGRRAVKRVFVKRIFYLFGFPMFLVLALYKGTGGDPFHDRLARQPIASLRAESKYELSKTEIQQLLADRRIFNFEKDGFEATYRGKPVWVDTSLDISLQRYLKKKLKRSTSRYIGIVIMDAATGKILSMVGYDKTDPSNNPCIDHRFPAASIFKIVTAAAVIETYGLAPNAEFTYNGRKYTLYKSQLKERRNRYTRKITLRDSFAQSVNPVFGKIGANRLGKIKLEKYAETFGFNRIIDFEIPFSPSSVTLSDEPYQLAEIASGFNRKTTLSALHGALLAAIIVNDGRFISPTIIEKVTDEDGRILYHSKHPELKEAISSEASQVVGTLMQATIRSGTSRKAFRGYRKDRVLSRLIIGGKTGSIYNKTRDARFDWFVGFAKEKRGPKKMAIAVVVAHEKYIGIRASQYARMAIRHYFKNLYSKRTVQLNSEGKSSG